MHSIFNKGLSYVDTSEYYSYLYKTIRSISRVLKEKDQLVPKPKGGVCYPILQDVHIQ